MDRSTKIDLSVIYYIKDILHNHGCNTIDEGYQDNLYRDEVPYYVKVINGWPEELNIPLPTVAFYSLERNDSGLQIGGGYYIRQSCVVDIFAKSDAEKNFLKTILYEDLLDKSSYVYDFDSSGFPEYFYSNSGNKLMKQFPSGEYVDSELWFENMSAVNLAPAEIVGDIMAHRVQLTFTAVCLR